MCMKRQKLKNFCKLSSYPTDRVSQMYLVRSLRMNKSLRSKRSLNLDFNLIHVGDDHRSCMPSRPRKQQRRLNFCLTDFTDKEKKTYCPESEFY
mmetsp:Transcript_14041/g.20786  ORF Transcript_14041/g.20786 Transcript_14041/m.20786 type:complete len:94 (-) Transcript_14041:14-295(-)